MREPADNTVKVWSRDYEERPFCFEHDSALGRRFIAWSEDPQQVKSAFYGVLNLFPQVVDILLKIKAIYNEKPQWSRYVGTVELWKLIPFIQQNEIYFFSDGMHQFCVKDSATSRYLAFDEHGIFFVYQPTEDDFKNFESQGFERRKAEPIYSGHYLIHTPPGAEGLEMKIVNGLGLAKANSDLEK